MTTNLINLRNLRTILHSCVLLSALRLLHILRPSAFGWHAHARRGHVSALANMAMSADLRGHATPPYLRGVTFSLLTDFVTTVRKLHSMVRKVPGFVTKTPLPIRALTNSPTFR